MREGRESETQVQTETAVLLRGTVAAGRLELTISLKE